MKNSVRKAEHVFSNENMDIKALCGDDFVTLCKSLATVSRGASHTRLIPMIKRGTGARNRPSQGSRQIWNERRSTVMMATRWVQTRWRDTEGLQHERTYWQKRGWKSRLLQRKRRGEWRCPPKTTFRRWRYRFETEQFIACTGMGRVQKNDLLDVRWMSTDA